MQVGHAMSAAVAAACRRHADGMQSGCRWHAGGRAWTRPNYVPQKNQPNLDDFFGVDLWKLFSGLKASQRQEEARTPGPNNTPRKISEFWGCFRLLGDFWGLISGLKAIIAIANSKCARRVQKHSWTRPNYPNKQLNVICWANLGD